jgi:hypothetical protein
MGKAVNILEEHDGSIIRVDPEYRGSMYLQNISNTANMHMVQNPRAELA